MATHNCNHQNQNCGCNNSYTVTAPCPPACPEVFNAQCIVYTGTDIICNSDTVISRYDYLDTIITKLVNYLCNVQAPVTEVVGSEYINVVPNVVGNITTYTVSVNVPALEAYFSTVFQLNILASILAGPGIEVTPNSITGTVTIATTFNKFTESRVITNGSGNTELFDHNLNTAAIIVSVQEYDGGSPSAWSLTPGVDYRYRITSTNQIEIENLTGAQFNPALVTVIG